MPGPERTEYLHLKETYKEKLTKNLDWPSFFEISVSLRDRVHCLDKLLDHQNEYSVETRLEARQTKMYVCTLEELYSSSISCSLYTSVGESELG